MSRDDGFARADTDTSLHSDPKVSRLLRAVLPDADLMNAAMVLYEAVRLASWRLGERVAADDAAPPWMLDVARPTDALVAAGLLDGEGRIPTHAWSNWFLPAQKRRRHQRDYWAEKKRRQRASPGDVPRGQQDMSTGDNDDVHVSSQPAIHPPSQPASQGGGGAVGIEAYVAVTGHRPGSETAKTMIRELVDAFGLQLFHEVLTAVHQIDPDPSTLLTRSRDRLRTERDKATTDERWKRANDDIEKMPGHEANVAYYSNRAAR